MSTGTDQHPLLTVSRPADGPAPCESLLTELRAFAACHEHCSVRSRHLHEQLRKMLGQERLVACLLGIQALVLAEEPAGARLLAALLDANTPGSALLPRVRRFRSAARLLAQDRDLVGSAFMNEWERRLDEAAAACLHRLGSDSGAPPDGRPSPGGRPPLPLLREALAVLVPAGAGRRSVSGSREDLKLLASLVRLENEAYQERVSRLAGTVDPFAVAAIRRLLPLLSRADAEIRDLDLLAAWLESGDIDQVFERRVPTCFDVLEEQERPRLTAALAAEPRLSVLAAVHGAFLVAPLSVGQVAGPAAQLIILGEGLLRAGLRDRPLSLLDAVRLVLSWTRDGVCRLPLPEDLQEAVGWCLLESGSNARHDLSGLQIQDGALIIRQPRLALSDRIWRHDLPTLQEIQAAAKPDAPDDGTSQAEEQPRTPPPDASAQAVKQLVMNNIGCVSILLGFLRNPKVTAIPGLVADVVRRTRSGRILEVIAGDRSLTSGHANKDVPRALLESPVNVSVKTLRPFIHVKYVSKTDLRRLARDKARLRKEVCLEIERYLESLK